MPFGSIVVVVLIWTCISVPLCLFGTVIGRNWNGVPDNPCRVKRIPSPIPEKKVRRRWAEELERLDGVTTALMGRDST